MSSAPAEFLLGQETDEFLAAIACEEIGSAHMDFAFPCDHLQDQIACKMTIAIIDLLKSSTSSIRIASE